MVVAGGSSSAVTAALSSLRTCRLWAFHIKETGEQVNTGSEPPNLIKLRRALFPEVVTLRP